MVWNPNYNPRTDDTYVFQFKVPNGKGTGMTKAYTVQCRRGNKSGNYDDVLNAMPLVPAWRAKWVQDLMSTDRYRSTLGAMTELLWQHAARQGSPKGKFDDKPTYGMSYLLVDHCSMVNGNLVIKYPGKDGVQQKHVTPPDTATNRRCIKIVTTLMKGKPGSAYLWTDANGARIGSTDVNRYLKSHGSTVTAHKFRHIRGTTMMQDLLDRLRIPAGTKPEAVKKMVKDLAIHVGELLGHVNGEKATAGMSLKNYIVPSILHKFFADRGIQTPDWVPTTGRSAGAKDEDE